MANIAVQNTEISVLNYNEQDYIPLTDMKTLTEQSCRFGWTVFVLYWNEPCGFGTLCRQLCSVKGHRP